MPSTTVTSKGQVTIPKRIREFLRVKPGDRIDFDIEASGKVVVRPAAPTSAPSGACCTARAGPP
jgi:AbrB family looped-hinge helix DNA binding protein